MEVLHRTLSSPASLKISRGSSYPGFVQISRIVAVAIIIPRLTFVGRLTPRGIIRCQNLEVLFRNGLNWFVGEHWTDYNPKRE
jgi:hypothetical protein